MKWLRSIGIAFSMYSKIPMPNIIWSKESMGNRRMAFSKHTGRKDTGTFFGCLSDPSASSHHRRDTYGRIYGYIRCKTFLL